MFLQSIEQLGARVLALTGVIYASEEFGLLQKIIDPMDSPPVVAMKTSAFLSASEVASDYLLAQVINQPPPSFIHSVTNMGYAFVSNALVLSC